MAQAAFWKADRFIGLSVLLMLLLVGLVLLAARRLGKMGGNKEKQPAESAEAKRMLGLAFQGQGQLDKAFDKFRECPMNEGLMENIYNLALDYERQREFKKSETVFRYLSTHNPTFRDLPARLGAKLDGEVAMGAHEPVEMPRPLRAGKRTRQGCNGCRLSGARQPEQPISRDQNHGAGSGVRCR